MTKILIVDDERNIRRVLGLALEKFGYEVCQAENVVQALRCAEEEQPDLVLTDVLMPGNLTGLDLLKELRARYPNLPVVMMTAYGSIPMAVEAIRNGAFEFLTKPLNDLDALKKVLRNALEESKLTPPKKSRSPARPKSTTTFIGQSPAIKAVLDTVSRVAPTRATVLITGESGTGKELIARMLHEQSDRAKGPFVPVSCAAIPETLIEVELFGAVRGAYTGAETDRVGKFESADHGTLFLDEIGELPLLIQAKLLRVIQERELHRLGSNQSITIDVRLITATNRDLEQEVQAGNFREDLYYRLRVVHIHLPPLRERPEDIPLLADHFMKKYAEENGRPLRQISPEVVALLQSHCWRGNVRELENTIEAAVALAPLDATVLLPEHLPPHFKPSATKTPRKNH
ncbi:MAG: two-component system response regulator [Armatimonadota bacterium]